MINQRQCLALILSFQKIIYFCCPQYISLCPLLSEYTAEMSELHWNVGMCVHIHLCISCYCAGSFKCLFLAWDLMRKKYFQGTVTWPFDHHSPFHPVKHITPFVFKLSALTVWEGVRLPTCFLPHCKTSYQTGVALRQSVYFWGLVLVLVRVSIAQL